MFRPKQKNNFNEIPPEFYFSPPKKLNSYELNVNLQLTEISVKQGSIFIFCNIFFCTKLVQRSITSKEDIVKAFLCHLISSRSGTPPKYKKKGSNPRMITDNTTEQCFF